MESQLEVKNVKSLLVAILLIINNLWDWLVAILFPCFLHRVDIRVPIWLFVYLDIFGFLYTWI